MTKSNQNLVKVDIFNVSRHQQTLTGTIAVAKMPELCKFLANEDGEFEVTIQGTKGAKGLPGAVLTVTGTVDSTSRTRAGRCGGTKSVRVALSTPSFFNGVYHIAHKGSLVGGSLSYVSEKSEAKALGDE